MHKHIIIEGIDGVGKTSLIQNILNTYGYYHVIHYEKPRKCAAYQNTNNPLFEYQKQSFEEGLKLLNHDVRVLFDRFHLGEWVYAPLYRKYDAQYIFDLERKYVIPHIGYATNTTRLILLTTSDFSFIRNDGNNFDFDAKEKEQELFIEAFNKSHIMNKVIIDVSAGNGSFKSPQEIFDEAINKKADYDVDAFKV